MAFKADKPSSRFTPDAPEEPTIGEKAGAGLYGAATGFVGGLGELEKFGADVVPEFLGFRDKAETENEILLKKELQKTFSPEFINRLDDIVYFKALEKEDVINILDVEISKIMPRLESLGYKVKVAQDLKEKIAENGFDPKFGARPIKRMLQKYVEDTLADLMVQGKIEEGSTVTLSYDSVKEADMQIPVKVKITAKKKPNQNDPDKH
jgi:ATP-dependent Clp protease ATP-binding subunit ClpC